MKEQKFNKNIPNLLTTLRIILIPFFILILTSKLDNHYLIVLIIFSLAAITDYLDGKLARKYNVVSKFGLFMDPLADKFLVLSALACFLYMDIFEVNLLILSVLTFL